MKEGTLMHDIRTFGTPAREDTPKKTILLSNDIQAAYTRLTQGLESTFHEHPRYTIRGNEFATQHTTLRNSTVFYQPTDGTALVPGVIRQIFSSSSNPDQVFLAIHRHLPAHWQLGDYDPFTAFPDFGAGIWSKETHDRVEVIPSTRRLYATDLRTWDEDKCVMKPVIEVRAMTSAQLGSVLIQISQDF